MILAVIVVASGATPATAQYYIKRNDNKTETVPKTFESSEEEIVKKAAPSALYRNTVPVPQTTEDPRNLLSDTKCTDQQMKVSMDVLDTLKIIGQIDKSSTTRTAEQRKAEADFEKIKPIIFNEEKNQAFRSMLTSCLNKQAELNKPQNP